MKKFDVVLLEEAKIFIDNLDDKSRKKVLYNIWKSKQINDPELFKRLDDEIWEFRTNYLRMEIRLLAFWDKTKSFETLVIATHGFFKKSAKTPIKEIEKAKLIKKIYFENEQR